MDITPALECWLRLSRVPGLGSAGLATLLEAFDSPENIVGASQAQLRRVIGDNAELLDGITSEPDSQTMQSDLEWLAQTDSYLVTITDPAYPPLLREIPDAPVLLYIRGNPNCLSMPQLAIVGSRNPTPAGSENARAFARILVEGGLAVTSGFALGIDAAAHQGAMEAGGKTVAVVGTGLDRVYPARHHQLAHQVVAHGAIVSEYPLGTPPLRENFPRRNRIISGLSLGTLVVEAALRSGSLITARLAAEQGREVFAIPGSIHSPLSKGCHRLIRQGAKLVETANDIIEELGALVDSLRQVSEREVERGSMKPDSSGHGELLEYLGYDPIDINTLVERSGLTPEAISSMLLDMELAGEIKSCAGGKYQRIHA
jgi:DNA processing protein